MKPLVIIGAGGHAKVLLDIATLCGFKVLGFSVPDESETKELFGFPVLGTDDKIIETSPQEVCLANALGSIGSLERRYEVFQRFHRRGFSFASLIHPAAIVAKDVIIGEGVQIMAGVVIQPGCSIGANTIVNTSSSIDHDCIIGNNVHIAPGVTISGGVVVGNCTHVGTGATVIQGVNIGDWSLIGAGSLVLRNVAARQKIWGVPARVAKNMRDWRKVLVKPGNTIREVIEIIDRESLQIALVVDEHLHLLGTVTDGDIRRSLLIKEDLSRPVSGIMNTRPFVLKEKTRQDKVLQIMRENSIHQIPIIDRQGRIVDLELLENSLL